MADTTLDEEKDSLIQVLTDDYARGAVDIADFERSVTRINSCIDRPALEREAATLGLGTALVALRQSPAPAPAHGPLEAIPLECVSGTIRKSGRWVQSGAYRLHVRSSSVRLDLRDYEGGRGFRLLLDIEAASSSIRITVPRGFIVEDRFTGQVSSTVRNRPKGDSYGDNRILLVGSLRSSVIKIHYR